MLRTILAAFLATHTPAPKHAAHPSPSPMPAATFIAECVHERTGPTGGISVAEARELCGAIVRNSAIIHAAVQRANAAIEACELAVSVACEDTTLRSVDSGECEDDVLRARGAFDPCH